MDDSEPRHRVTLNVGDMTCAACARRVELALAGVPGVSRAAVNLATEEATVEYDPAQAAPAALAEAVTAAGYRVLGEAEVLASQAQRRRRRLQQQRRHLLAALAFWAPAATFEMAGMLRLPLPAALRSAAHPVATGVLLLVLTLPVIWLGRSMFVEGVRAFARAAPNMFSLVTVGTGAAFLYSLAELAAAVAGRHDGHDMYFPAVSTIITLVLLGRHLEARSLLRAGAAIEALVQLQPAQATVVRDGRETRVPAATVRVGDEMVIRPGERVPADGVVLAGAAAVDESMVTGESLPVAKEPGARVIGGSVDRDGLLRVRATRVGSETVLARIIRLVRDAQQGKPRLARLADTVSGYFVPAVMLVAVVAGASWWLAGAAPGFALRVAVAVLIVACPCSLGLATPTAILVGTGRGAQLGVLVRTPEALERVGSLDTIVLDKTGTITGGEPRVTSIACAGDGEAAALLALAASVEAGSEHPLARAIVAAARARELPLAPVGGFVAVPGQGARGTVEGRQVIVGNRRMLAAAGLDPATVPFGSTPLQPGHTPVWVAVDGRVAGMLQLADVPRPSSGADIAAMHGRGLRVVMVTGDARQTAESIAAQVGVDEVHAEALPEDKVRLVRELQARGRRVGMVGDGINDAPALAQADVGIAIAAGTDVAMESADVILMHDRLRDVVVALELGAATLRTIKQNLFWAFFYNIVTIPVAAGLLHVFGGPLLDPMLASAAMALSSVSVVGNALRLRRFRQ